MLGTVSFLALASSALAQTWYTLDFQTPNNITNFRGSAVVPNYPSGYPGSGGTYYLWPGLQSSNTGQTPGVYQNVLEPSTNTNDWSVGSGYCCSNSIPWGNEIYPDSGQEFWFNNNRNSDGTWTSQLGMQGGSAQTDDTFQLQAYDFNIAVWALELYSPASWNFGEFAFYDVYVTWVGSDPSPCNDNSVTADNGSFNYAVDGASATVNDDGTVTCYFKQILFESP